MAKNLTIGLQRGLRQSIAGGLGTGDLFSIASLDLQFARHKSLDSRVTHTRQSSATYVGGDGVIRTAVTNLLTYSEDFSNAVWDATSSATKVSATGVDDPFGGTTASTWRNDGTGFGDGGIRRTISGTSGLTYTYSAWIRRRTGTGVISMAAGQNTRFDVTNQVTSEWNRISVTNTADATTRGYIFIETPGDEIDILGAQIEQSSTVGQYVKTTTAINSAPRFDHDPETGESLGLLVEESRANLNPYSRYENGQWTFGAASIGTSTKTAVDGETITAFLTDTSTTAHRVNRSLSGAYTAGTVVTFSFYVAKPSNSDIRGLVIRLRTAAGGQAVAVGVSDDGDNSVYTFTSSSPFGASPPPAITSGSFSAVPVGNKWTRISIVTQASSVNTNYTQWDIGFSTAVSTDTGAGTANSELFIDAVQLEAGSFATSYITTEGSTVTRAADVASITGTNFSSWYNQSEGTMFTDAKILGIQSQPVIAAFKDGQTNSDEYISTWVRSTGAVRFGGAAGGATQWLINSGTPGINTPFKTAHSWAQNNIAVVVDGGNISTDTSALISSALDRLHIGRLYGSAQQLSGTISRLTYWPTRLSNDTLQTITV